MPKSDGPMPRQAERTTIVKDVVPAPPLPESTPLFHETPGSQAAGAEDGFDAFLFLRSLKPDDWQHYMVYLYWTPPGQRRLGPNIDVINDAISLEQIKKRFGGSGGGEFAIWVNRVSEPTWRKVQRFEIEGERIFEGKPTNAMPPAAASSEIAQLANVVNRLLDRLDRPDTNAQGAIDMTREAYKTSLATIAGSGANPQQSGGIIETIKVLKELGVIGGGGNSILDTIKTLRELGLIGAIAAGGNDPLKMVETFGKLMAAVKEISPEGAEGGDWKARAVSIAADLVPRLPGIISDVAKAAEWNARARPEPAPATNPTPGAAPAMPAQDATAQPGQPPAEMVKFDMESFLWERVAYMIETDNDGDQIAQYLHFSTASPPDPETGKVVSIIAHFLPFTPGGLLALLDSKPRIQAALAGKNKEEIAEHFLYFCVNGELFDEYEAGDEIPESDAPKGPRIV